MKLIVTLMVLHFCMLIETQKWQQIDACVQEGIKVECSGIIPSILPDNTTEVRIKDYSKETMGQSVFKDRTWINVHTLDIHGKGNILLYEIEDFTFQPLSKLTVLKINGPLLTQFGVNSLTGLDDLEVLDLSGCLSLDMKTLLQALINRGSTPILKTLLLDRVGNKYNRILHLDNTFFEVIVRKNISKLSLANTKIYIESSLRIDDIILPIVEFNLSNVNVFGGQSMSAFTTYTLSIFERLKMIDLSGFEYREIGRPKNRVTKYLYCSRNNPRFVLICNLRSIIANNLKIDIRNYLTDVIIDATQCRCTLQVIQMRSCGIEVINMTMLTGKEAVMIDVDFSRNNMRYFRIKGNMPINKLKLSHNRLHEMETTPDFIHTFRNFPLLEDLNLEYNGLRNLPRGVFLNNRRLENLRLQGNFLSTLPSETRLIQNLRHIDLRKNKIGRFKTMGLNVIDELDRSQKSSNCTWSVEVDFRSNPIDCSCNGQTFVIWVWSKRKLTGNSVYDLKCSLDGVAETDIGQDTVRHIAFLCQRPLILAMVTITATLTIVISLALILTWRFRVKKREIRRFITRFKERKTDERFIAFVSHSKNDRLLVYTCIRNRLEDALRKLLRVDFDLLCLGDIHFLPGYRLEDNIHRSVTESCVVIFVVSRAFCQSGFCQNEIREAYARNKPIILMFVEDVDERLMSPLMQSIFREFARVKITREDDGRFVVTPSWESISLSVITLAATGSNRHVFQGCWRRSIPRDYHIVPQHA